MDLARVAVPMPRGRHRHRAVVMDAILKLSFTRHGAGSSISTWR
jgi:hypothetical protein